MCSLFSPLSADACPTLLNILVVIVGGIPIAMPTVLSVTLALGAYTLAKEGAIVARQSAVEELSALDILCSDKTGELRGRAGGREVDGWLGTSMQQGRGWAAQQAAGGGFAEGTVSREEDRLQGR